MRSKFNLPQGTLVFIPPAVTFWQWFWQRWVFRGGWYRVDSEGYIVRLETVGSLHE